MFCKRRIAVDPNNKEQIKRMNSLILQRKYQFVVGEGSDVLRGWCQDVRVDTSSFLILTDVILDVTKKADERRYQEHSELRFFNTPFAAFINEKPVGQKEGKEPVEE